MIVESVIELFQFFFQIVFQKALFYNRAKTKGSWALKSDWSGGCCQGSKYRPKIITEVEILWAWFASQKENKVPISYL